MRPDHSFAHPEKPLIEAHRPHALRRHTGAFEQQEKFFGQQLRLLEPGGGA
jgi:hypothetical protein